jgi:predicted ATPase
MITRIEIHGFKNLLDFKVDLEPFIVIAGPNAGGKSNFFDALLLLKFLAEEELSKGFASARGEPLQQFTMLTPEKRFRQMEFAVEAILPREVHDQWGDKAALSQTHLRYELTLTAEELGTGPRIRVTHERLISLRKQESLKRLIFRPSNNFIHTHLRWEGGRQAPYISMEGGRVVLHQDGRQGRKREYQPQASVSTVLSAANSVTFRHAFAMRQELVGIRLLQLDPQRLRSPSKITPFSSPSAAQMDFGGGNLPAALERLESTSPELLAAIAHDLRAVVRDLKKIDVIKDESQQQLVARAWFDHGGPFAAGLMSDGTLRLLALAALRHDPAHSGVLAFEEPENGIHPLRLEGLLKILKGLATDPTERMTSPLRQLLVNTHSPALVSIVSPRALRFATTSRHYDPELGGAVLASQFLPVRDELPLRQRGERPQFVSRGEVVEYLSSVDQERWTHAEDLAE